MVTDIASFVSKIKAVDEMGTRACLSLFVGDLSLNPRFHYAPKVLIREALRCHNKYHDQSNGRLHVWMDALGPRLVIDANENRSEYSLVFSYFQNLLSSTILEVMGD